MRTPLFVVATLAVAAMPAIARAQPPAPTLEDLAKRVKPGEEVWVLDTSGVETKARVLGVTATRLSIETRKRRMDLGASEVARVRARRQDPLWNGALIGFLASVAYPVWFLSRSYETGETLGENIDDVLIGGMMFAGVGAWIDSRVKGRRVVYERRLDRARLRVSPAFSPRAAGVSVTLQFSPAAR